MRDNLGNEIRYPEDIAPGSDYFGPLVVKVERIFPEQTYLCIYVFTLEDGTKRELFYDHDL